MYLKFMLKWDETILASCSTSTLCCDLKLLPLLYSVTMRLTWRVLANTESLITTSRYGSKMEVEPSAGRPSWNMMLGHKLGLLTSAYPIHPSLLCLYEVFVVLYITLHKTLEFSHIRSKRTWKTFDLTNTAGLRRWDRGRIQIYKRIITMSQPDQCLASY